MITWHWINNNNNNNNILTIQLCVRYFLLYFWSNKCWAFLKNILKIFLTPNFWPIPDFLTNLYVMYWWLLHISLPCIVRIGTVLFLTRLYTFFFLFWFFILWGWVIALIKGVRPHVVLPAEKIWSCSFILLVMPLLLSTHGLLLLLVLSFTWNSQVPKPQITLKTYLSNMNWFQCQNVIALYWHTEQWTRTDIFITISTTQVVRYFSQYLKTLYFVHHCDCD